MTPVAEGMADGRAHVLVMNDVPEILDLVAGFAGEGRR